MARKILLADDSVTAQNMGRKILADAGYEVITVNNGSAALKKIGETKPDLIVLDVYMPGYSGLEVCQRLKDVGETARIPVLLTVGKLEPFKPEEARRVRADGYIVKPFEASELLSALSKLEDKVVPRAESSKPGRFARATAAIEEGRYDKTMAIEDDDSGWKNRISFPSKKKEKPPEKEIDTAEIYNPVNKDLRTVVEHKISEAAPTASHATAASVEPTEQAVNLGALAPEGLPKDVTPEEIAALAAAAAQIQGKAIDAAPAAQAEKTANVTPVVEAAPLAQAETAKPESKEEQKPVESSVTEEVAATAPPATLAAQEAPEKTEEKKSEHKSGPAEVMAAIAGLETEWVSLPAVGLGNGSWSGRSEKESEEPVTMAVAAGAETAPAPARWAAVAVALAPEEGTVSLEQEMQKAHAAFAAAEVVEAAAPVVSELKPAPETSVASIPVSEPAVSEAEAPVAAVSVSAPPVPETSEPLAAVAAAASEAISTAVKEFETVTAKHNIEQSAAFSAPDSEKSLKAEALESPTAAVEADVKSEAKIEAEEQKANEKLEEKIEQEIEAKLGEPVEKRIEALVEPPIREAPAEPVLETAAPPNVPQVEVSEKKDESIPEIHAPEVVAKVELSEESPSSEQVSTEPVPVSRASTAGGIDDMAKRESETAAAWASWRKIRETGTSKPAEPAAKESEEKPLSEDKAAMAVAVGAESSPEEATGSFDSDPEIASIVDSVLADMRPKIVEEIARKLGKKK